MDTSETYIKMCEKAEEIQREWKPKIGDWVKVINKVEWDAYKLCADTGEIVVVLGIDKKFGSDEPIIGDVANVGLYPESSWLGFNSTPRDNLVWLPRQSQLQEMIDWKGFDISIDWHSLPCKFYWAKDPLETQGVNGDSMEQLWLAFVYKEKYNKVWNGTDWVADKVLESKATGEKC